MRLRNVSTVFGIRYKGKDYGEGDEFEAGDDLAHLVASGHCVEVTKQKAPKEAPEAPAPGLPVAAGTMVRPRVGKRTVA